MKHQCEDRHDKDAAAQADQCANEAGRGRRDEEKGKRWGGVLDDRLRLAEPGADAENTEQ